VYLMAYETFEDVTAENPAELWRRRLFACELRSPVRMVIGASIRGMW
jgi:hypothetical protein